MSPQPIWCISKIYISGESAAASYVMPLPENHLSLIKHNFVILGVNNPEIHSNNLI